MNIWVNDVLFSNLLYKFRDLENEYYDNERSLSIFIARGIGKVSFKSICDFTKDQE